MSGIPLLPSPPAGEGAPKGRMRGRSGINQGPLIRRFAPPSPTRGEGKDS